MEEKLLVKDRNKEMLDKIKKKISDVNWWIIALVVVLSYGFLLTNQSIGIDDENFDFYFKNNGIVAAGRWGSWLLYKIFNTYDYFPVWRDFIAILILTGAAVMFICIYESVSQTVLDKFISTTGVALIISYPIIAKMFVYIDNSVETAACIFFGTFSYYIYVSEIRNIYIKYISVAIVLILGIALIENTAVYFCIEVCLFGFLNKTEKKISALILKPAGILCLSVLVSKIFGRLIAKFLGVIYTDYGSMSYMKWGEVGGLDDIVLHLKGMVSNFDYYMQKYFSIKLFFIALLFWISVGIYQIVKKEVVKSILAFGIVGGSFLMFLISLNENMPLRIYTSNFIAVAGAIIYLYLHLQRSNFRTKKLGKSLFALAVVFIIFYNTREINAYYQLDYKRYLRDVDVARNVNNDLQKTLGMVKPNKPIVFLGEPEQYNDIVNEGEISLITIYSNNLKGESIRIHRFFSMLGYEYPNILGEPVTIYNHSNFVNNSNIARAVELSANMAAYPANGYIRIEDEMIIVKLGEANGT